MPDGQVRTVPPGPRAREIIDKLQETYRAIFNPRASFDGGKSMYTTTIIKDQNVSLRHAYWSTPSQIMNTVSCQYGKEPGFAKRNIPYQDQACERDSSEV